MKPSDDVTDVPIVYFLIESILERGELIFYLGHPASEKSVVKSITAACHEHRCTALHISMQSTSIDGRSIRDNIWSWTVPKKTDDLVLKKVSGTWVLYDVYCVSSGALKTLCDDVCLRRLGVSKEA